MVQAKVATVVLVVWLIAGVAWSVAFAKLRLRYEVRRRIATRQAERDLTVDDRNALVRALLTEPRETALR